eukprot:3415019-Pyramimonas_sp.AAC.1
MDRRFMIDASRILRPLHRRCNGSNGPDMTGEGAHLFRAPGADEGAVVVGRQFGHFSQGLRHVVDVHLSRDNTKRPNWYRRSR